MSKLARMNVLALRAVALAASAVYLPGCANENPPFDPRAIQRSEREAARDVAPEPMRPLPTTLQSDYLPDRNGRSRKPTTVPTTGPSLTSRLRLRMPLQEIIHRAVANNLDVKVAGYAPAIEASRAIEAEARFDPTVFSNIQYEHRNNRQAFTTSIARGNVDRENIVTGQVGIRQNLESGGQVELRYQSVFTDVHEDVDPTLQSVNPNPFYENQLILQLQQPLLQNFGNDINQARISIARNNQRISLLDFKKQIEESTANIEEAYWQLAQAEQDLRTAEQLLNVTIDTANVLIVRGDQDVTRVQLSQANASVESRRAALIRAKSNVENFSDRLKQLMNDPDMPVTSGVLILPADKPVEEPFHFDLESEVETALQNRFELGQQQFRIDSANVAANVAKNNELPSLNFQGQVGYQGLGASEGEAFHNQNEYNNLNYQIGLQFEYPLGNRAALAVTRRARLQQMQAIAQYRQLVDQIALEVKQSMREVQTSWAEIAARRQARFAQADSLAAFDQRQIGGEALTPSFVNLKLQAQEQLAQAARDETEAIARYNISVSRLERAKGTLLRYNNVMMEELDQQMASR